MTILEKLRDLSDEKYADFHSKLMPGFPREKVLGVRAPKVKQLAKELKGTDEAKAFLDDLPHKFHDENELHIALINLMKDYGECLAAVEKFLPYIDNWAICDGLSPKVFKKHPDEFLPHVISWLKSDELYISRFGVVMLMSFYLDEEFKPELLEYPAKLTSEEYYSKMAVAWYFATALAKQWDATIPYIKERRLEPWTHRKSIQKAIESFRITADQKAYLRTLK